MGILIFHSGNKQLSIFVQEGSQSSCIVHHSVREFQSDVCLSIQHVDFHQFEHFFGSDQNGIHAIPYRIEYHAIRFEGVIGEGADWVDAVPWLVWHDKVDAGGLAGVGVGLVPHRCGCGLSTDGCGGDGNEEDNE